MSGDAQAELRARTLHRLDILARQFDRLAPAGLRRVAVEADTPERERLRRRAEDRVVGAGLGGIYDDARQRFRSRVIELYNVGGFDPTAVGLNWGRTNGTADDRTQVLRVVDDAVLATVGHDVIPVDDRLGLSAPYDIIVSMQSDRPRRRPDPEDPAPGR